MTIRFLCPSGHKLAVPDNLAGKKGRCPVCQQRVYIPVLESADASSDARRSEQPSLPPIGSGDRGSSELSDEAIGGFLHGSPATPPFAPPVAGAAYVPTSAGPSALAPPVEASPSSETNGSSGESKLGPPPIPGFDPSSGDGPPPLEPPVGAVPGPGDWPEAPELPPPAGVPGETVAQELSVIIDEPEGYQADAGKVLTAYLLAAALGALTLLCAAPALRHINLAEAPNWARVVLIASAIQLVFICWMVSLPDWSTVWICMVVFAVVAALYGVAWAVITFTPDYMPVNFLDLDDPPDQPIRSQAGSWCLVVLILATLLTYACGRFSGRWRKQYELAKSMRE